MLKRVITAGLILLLAACTDYVGQIDEKIEDCRAFENAKAESLVPISEKSVDPSSVFEGTLKDSRDDKEYRTVTIGALTWMAENLNYKTEGSYCYNDDTKNCSKYGRLYTWATAMDSAASFSSNGEGCGYGEVCAPTYPVRGVCPEGWHIPSYGEWETLRFAVGSSESDGDNLKSKKGWNNNSGGSDTYGFSVLASGAKTVNGKYFYEGSNAYFWLSTESLRNSAYYVYFDHGIGAYDNSSEKNYAYSVRCVKDVTDEKLANVSSSLISSSSSSSSSSSKAESSSSSATRPNRSVGSQTARGGRERTRLGALARVCL